MPVVTAVKHCGYNPNHRCQGLKISACPMWYCRDFKHLQTRHGSILTAQLCLVILLLPHLDINWLLQKDAGTITTCSRLVRVRQRPAFRAASSCVLLSNLPLESMCHGISLNQKQLAAKCSWPKVFWQLCPRLRWAGEEHLFGTPTNCSTATPMPHQSQL